MHFSHRAVTYSCPLLESSQQPTGTLTPHPQMAKPNLQEATCRGPRASTGVILTPETELINGQSLLPLQEASNSALSLGLVPSPPGPQWTLEKEVRGTQGSLR